MLTELLGGAYERHPVDMVVHGDVSIFDAISWSITPSPLMYIAGMLGKYESQIMFWLQRLGRDVALRDRIEEVRGAFDYIVLDSDDTYDGTVENALVAATGIIIPISTEHDSLDGAQELEGWTTRLRRDYPEMPQPRYFVSREPADGIRPETEDWLEDLGPDRVFQTRIPESIKKAPNDLRLPLRAWDRHDVWSAYEQLVDEVVQVFPPSGTRNAFDPKSLRT
jgi:chromosome partitioning protein